MKRFLLLCATLVLLGGCYIYPSGSVIVEQQPTPRTVVVYPQYYTVAPVCCTVFFGGRWHHSPHHWNHGYRRGWHHNQGRHNGWRR
jgi:hypothetical protein